MAQIVDPHGRDACLSEDAVQNFPHGIGVIRLAGFAGEHQSFIDIILRFFDEISLALLVCKQNCKR